MTITFNVHEFLKNRTNKSAAFLAENISSDTKNLSTGPTRSITITITMTLRLYISITNTITLKHAIFTTSIISSELVMSPCISYLASETNFVVVTAL